MLNTGSTYADEGCNSAELRSSMGDHQAVHAKRPHDLHGETPGSRRRQQYIETIRSEEQRSSAEKNKNHPRDRATKVESFCEETGSCLDGKSWQHQRTPPYSSIRSLRTGLEVVEHRLNKLFSIFDGLQVPLGFECSVRCWKP